MRKTIFFSLLRTRFSRVYECVGMYYILFAARISFVLYYPLGLFSAVWVVKKILQDGGCQWYPGLLAYENIFRCHKIHSPTMLRFSCCSSPFPALLLANNSVFVDMKYLNIKDNKFFTSLFYSPLTWFVFFVCLLVSKVKSHVSWESNIFSSSLKLFSYYTDTSG